MGSSSSGSIVVKMGGQMSKRTDKIRHTNNTRSKKQTAVINLKLIMKTIILGVFKANERINSSNYRSARFGYGRSFVGDVIFEMKNCTLTISIQSISHDEIFVFNITCMQHKGR